MTEPLHLQRFVDAQAPVYLQVCRELRSGRKTGHWIWFIFPQIDGLGSSPTAVHYAIGSRAEAEAYLAHELLGARLRECTALVLNVQNRSDVQTRSDVQDRSDVQNRSDIQNRSAEQIFGALDAMKFRSSMTLFAQVAPPDSVFVRALERFFAGQPDPATLTRL